MAGELLFPMLAEASKRIISLSFDWVTKKALKVSASCPQCDTDHDREVLNLVESTITCPTCGFRFERQYTRATKRTVRADNSIVAAHASNFDMDVKLSHVFRNVLGYYVFIDVLVANSENNDIPLQFYFKGRHGDRCTKKEAILAPKKRSEGFKKVEMYVAREELPKFGEGLQIDIFPSYNDERLCRGVTKLLREENGRWMFLSSGWSMA